MAASGDLIDFDIIEGHKENIQSLPSGRSAKALANLLSPVPSARSPLDTQDANSEARQEFEKELSLIDESDDPLDIYDRYVKWTIESYPNAQAKESQLLPLLERATKTFLKSDQYKNDARYLKLWLHYIRMFSDAPRETFAFLARHQIAEKLALYYEEFAAWLESQGRWNQAEEVYGMGIDKEARPVERLIRKYGEFQHRAEARQQRDDEPSSPALPPVRRALGEKADPFASASPVDPQARDRAAAARPSKSSSKQKIAIFSDDSAPPKPGQGDSGKGWESIGSLADRKKENTREAQPWAGQTLKGGKKAAAGAPKMMIFKDQSKSTSNRMNMNYDSPSSKMRQMQTTVNPRTGRKECVFVNLEAVYPGDKPDDAEYCFEELRARHRGWLDMDWASINTQEEDRQAAEMRNELEQNSPTNAAESLASDLQMSPVLPDENEVSQLRPVKKKMLDIFREDDIPEPVILEQEKAPKTKGLNIFREEAPVVIEQKKPSKSKGLDIFREEEQVPVEQKKPSKSKGLEIFRDTAVPLNDENDENAPPSQEDIEKARLARKQRREERANRTRKIKVMEVRGETQTVKTNLSSPTGKGKLKKKKAGNAAEPTVTMTINTKEAMAEIYDIFSQPLSSQEEQQEQSEASDDSEEDDDDDDYTSGAESTMTGQHSVATSEYGDETAADITVKSIAESTVDDGGDTGYSDFSIVKPGQQLDEEESEEEEEDGVEHNKPSKPKGLEIFRDDIPPPAEDDENLITPTEASHPTRYVPLPPEDFEIERRPYRDPRQVAQNRLPFMTPIVEKTESTIGAATAIAASQKDYFNSKTPSRTLGAKTPTIPEVNDDDLLSSPFQELTLNGERDESDFKVPQPPLPKPKPGTKKAPLGVSKATVAQPLAPKDKGPIIKDAQCNPVDEHIRATILENIQPPLASYDGYFDRRPHVFSRGTEIKKFTKAASKMSKNSSDKTATNLAMPPTLHFEGSDRTYTLKRELGKGAFAPVYLIESKATDENDEVDNDAPAQIGKGAFRQQYEALKSEDPPSAWEFYILRTAHRRLGVHRATDSIVRAHEMHLFADEGYLIEEYRDQGTLLDVINLARADTTGSGVMDETLAMFFTIELFRVVEALHAKGVIHGDLKADNVLVRLDRTSDELPAQWHRDGRDGWNKKGVSLIDFGRGIDMKVFKPDVQFIADWKTTEADCAEMRELRPWTYQVDYHGLAGIVHSLLFGKYIETVAERGGSLGAGATKTYRIREGLKRYWQTEIWQGVFGLLLNPLQQLEGEEGRKLPVLRGMRECRERMESWLQGNCERGMGLKGAVRKVEAQIKERRR